MKYQFSILIAAGFVFLAPLTALGEAEVTGFGVKWNVNHCGGSNLPYATLTLASFLNEIDNYGYYTQIVSNKNAQVDDYDWIDEDEGGNDKHDPYGTDFADVIFFIGHGLHNFSTHVSRLSMGDEGGQCEVALGDEVILGDRDANVLLMYSSVCMQYEAWTSGPLASLDGGGSGGELAYANGMHGSPLAGSELIDQISDYVYAAEDSGIGPAWLSTFYDDNSPTEETEDCPVSIVWAESQATADERWYNGGLADFGTTGTHTYSVYYYLSGCEPYFGSQLP